MGGKTDLTLAKAMGLVIKKNREKRYPGHGGQAKCASDFGVSPSEWSRWERGVKTPSAANQRNLAEFFGIYIGELWGEEVGAARNEETNLRTTNGESVPQNPSLEQIATLLDSLCPHDTDSFNLLDFLRMVDLSFRQEYGNTYIDIVMYPRCDDPNAHSFFQLLLSQSSTDSRYKPLRCNNAEMSHFIAETVKEIKNWENASRLNLSCEGVLKFFRNGLAVFAWHKLMGRTDRLLRLCKWYERLSKDEESFSIPIRFYLTDAQMAKALQYMFGTGNRDSDRPAETPKERYQHQSLLSVFSMYKEIVERLGHYIDDIERGTIPAKEGKTVFLDLLKLIYHRVEGDPAPEPEPIENNGGSRQNI